MRAIPVLLLSGILAAQIPGEPRAPFDQTPREPLSGLPESGIVPPPKALRKSPDTNEGAPPAPSGRFASPLGLPRVVSGQSPATRSASLRLKDLPPFLGGALGALVIHESGHYAMDLALGTDPYVKRVDAAGIPFFAVTYRKAVTPRQEYAIAAAGFWMQHGMAEAILAKYPHVWREAPTAIKGAFAFHLATSLLYAYAALAKSGPPERDTLGMAHGLNISERWVGLAMLLPAALDLYRSLHPNVPWAAWSSRGVKIGFVFALTR